MGIQPGPFTEGTCDSYDGLISCEKARIRWRHEGNNGNNFRLPCRPGAAWLLRTMRRAGFCCHSTTSQFWSKTGQLTSTHWLSNAEVISLVFSEVCPTPNLEIQWQNTPLQPVFLFIFKAPYHTICFISLSRHFRGPFSHPW